jgi:hypothetical protein
MRRVSGHQAAFVARWLAPAVAVAAALALVGGCAPTAFGGLSKDSPAATKEAAVGKRAEERWQAIIRGDIPGAYAYFSPASRQVIRQADFVAQMSKFPYRGVRVDKVECEAEVCTVSLTLTYDNPQMRMTNVPTPLQESWILEGGDAWLVYRA